jgi:hypothetical protein
VFFDVGESNAYEADQDMVIKLAGITEVDLAGMAINNFAGATSFNII